MHKNTIETIKNRLGKNKNIKKKTRTRRKRKITIANRRTHTYTRQPNVTNQLSETVSESKPTK